MYSIVRQSVFAHERHLQSAGRTISFCDDDATSTSMTPAGAQRDASDGAHGFHMAAAHLLQLWSHRKGTVYLFSGCNTSNTPSNALTMNWETAPTALGQGPLDTADRAQGIYEGVKSI